ncbi:hypothetical protein BHE74_00010939 [Ensete ventricosum]|nr:hypothetical protein GW17_00019139 [Ensete ventricosum]RWW80704.1 hypothetical protein BHE74_00010939 [Ensete ventricosum]RZR85408.1 hypothetical protein BHM03_00012383 [Ensete ventricosum]
MASLLCPLTPKKKEVNLLFHLGVLLCYVSKQNISKRVPSMSRPRASSFYAGRTCDDSVVEFRSEVRRRSRLIVIAGSTFEHLLFRAYILKPATAKVAVLRAVPVGIPVLSSCIDIPG